MRTQTTEQEQKAIDTLNNLDHADILTAYNGREGCRCGCRGTYKYNPDHRELSSEQRGYEVDDDEVSMRSIKITLTKMKKMAKDGNNVIVMHDAMDDGQMIIDIREPHGRVHTLYFFSN